MVHELWRIADCLGVIGLFVPIWLFHLVPLLVVSVPLWFFGRRRAKWSPWDFSIIFVPFAVWAFLMLINDSGKTLANMIEGIAIGCVIPLAPLTRVLVKDRVNERALAIVLVAGMCLVAVAFWAFVPALPE
jgi:hypothetical protein